MIDFRTRNVIDMIPTRDQEQVSLWLKSYPFLKLISRDGSKAYKKAIYTAHPNALQVTDRFHLLGTLIERAKQDLTQRLNLFIYESWEPIQTRNISCQKTKQSVKIDAKIEFIERVRTRFKEVDNVSLIAKEFSLSRDTIRKYVKEDWKPQENRLRASILDPYKERIQAWLVDGENPMSIYKRLGDLKLDVAYETVLHFIRKRIEPKKGQRIKCRIHRNKIVQLLYNKGLRDLSLSTDETRLLKDFLNTHKDIQGIIDVVVNFRIILASKDIAKLHIWMDTLKHTDYTYLKRFLDTINNDYEAILNSVVLDESNGIAEGKINKIKRIKREMYGRCNFETLKQKIFLSEFST